MVVKVRMQRWWVDETKGYQLQELGTGKLNTLREIRYEEDD